MPLLSSFSLNGPTGALSGGGGALEEFTKIYSYTGGAQTFATPAETSSIQVFVWGAGAGGRSQSGGGGGFSRATINSAANTTFKIIVGNGGQEGRQENGCGGGLSGVFTNSWGGNVANTDLNASIVIAGAGGGGSDSNGSGGGGGGNSGQGGHPGGGQGGGGQQNQTNNYGGQSGGNCTAPQGHCHGRALRGGTGCGGGEVQSGDSGWPCQVYGGTYCSAAGGNGCNGAGGGAGYYGGGGGGSSPNSSPGGGGSGYIGGHPNHPVSDATTYQANYQTIHPQASGSPHYTPGVGSGTASGRGGSGRIVIVYEAFQEV